MKKNNFRKTIAGIMSVCLAGMIMLTGCNDKKSDSNSGSSSSDNSSSSAVQEVSGDINADYVYREAKNIEFANSENIGINNICSNGQNLYVIQIKYSDDYSKSDTSVVEYSADGELVKSVPISLGDSESINTTPVIDADGNIYFVTYFYEDTSSDNSADGDAVPLDENAAGNEDSATDETVSDENSASDDSVSDDNTSDDSISDDNNSDDTGSFDDYDSGNEKYTLYKCDKDGNILFQKDLSEYANDNNYFYINNINVSDSGNIYMLDDTRVIVFDGEGNEVFQITDDDISNTIAIAKSSDGNMIFMYMNQSDYKLVMREIDEQSKSLKDAKEIEGMPSQWNGITNGNGDYDVCLYDLNNMYGINFETGKTDKIVNWIDSNINASNVTSTAILEGGKIVVTYYDDTSLSSVVSILEKADAETVKSQQVITMAGNYIDSSLYSAVTKFNKTNEKYRIKVQDYSEYSTDDDWNAGQTKLNADLVTGNIPDIILASNGMALESLASKGIFADINELFANDSEINRSDYMENIFDAYQSADGKLYYITPSFYVNTLIGKPETLGDIKNWTLGEFMDFAENLDEGTQLFNDENLTSDNLFSMLCYSNLNQFVDFENKTCDFSNDDFIRLLEFVSKYPTTEEYYNNMDEDTNYDEIYQENYQKYRDGRIVLEQGTFGDFSSMYQLEKMDFGGDIEFIGYPSKDGKGSYANPNILLGVSAKSDNQQAAWEFIKYILSDEYQENQYMGIPVKKSAIDKMAENNMTPYTYVDENGETVVDENVFSINGVEFKIGYMDEEDKNRYMDFLNSINKAQTYNEEVYNIINEEVQAYFSKQKSAKETADIIQNRVKTYINETL